MTYGKPLADNTCYHTITSMFELQASKYPNEVALIYETCILTYQALDERANQLAGLMKSIAQIEPDNLIAVCLDRNENLIISLLAVLKTGGAYVPIDPNFPIHRIEYILKDTCPKLIICNQSNLCKISSVNQNTSVLLIDEPQTQNKINTFPIKKPEANISNKNLAYVIYTSGTTGTPKGVMIEHASFIELIHSIQSLHFNNKEQINTYSITNYVFDIFGLEYGLPLFSGGTITLGNIEFSQLNCSNYSFLQMTPSFICSKLDEIIPSPSCKLFIGGEPLSPQLLRKSLKKFSSVTNLYGPTETTIWSTAKIYTQEKAKITLGKAFANEELYILDQNLHPAQQGDVGELYIGGIGLARGYLNLDDLTQEKFINSPFNNSQKLYKTGDMVRVLVNNDIEYIGRNDFQVKIRGYRIELGEIETVLSEFPGIQQSIVVSKTYQLNNLLIGYFVSKEPLEESRILNYLESKLPNYMIPQKLIGLTKFPLTFNGKIDRNALPEPIISLFSDSYIPPSNELENTIVKIWQTVLGLNEAAIGLDDDFFKLGGNSISAIKIISEINKKFKLQLKIVDIFINKTLGLFVKKITNNDLKYQSIIKFNDTEDFHTKPYIFMIHPASSGCEVYSSLATKIKNIFNCYGIDSYNLYNKPKIEKLNELAQYYLNQINLHIFQQNIKEWHIFGWSFGGQIAMEMAYILEQNGFSNINIYLLDTVLNDLTLFKIRTELDIHPLKEHHKKNALLKGYDEEYVKLIIENMEIEHKLICQNITNSLTKSKVYLFKASLVENTEMIQSNSLIEYISNLESNNIEFFLSETSKLHLYQVEHANHNNILTQEEYINEVLKKIIIENDFDK